MSCLKKYLFPYFLLGPGNNAILLGHGGFALLQGTSKTCVVRSFPNKGSNLAFSIALCDWLVATVQTGETCKNYYSFKKSTA